MTFNPSMTANLFNVRDTRPHLVNVRGIQLQAGDTRELYRQKIARITLDSMVQFVGLLDAQGTVLDINQVALDGVGIKLSDVEAKPFWTTFWWQVRDEGATLRASIARAAQGEFVRWDAEICGRAGGTETIIIDASLSPVMDSTGKVVFITAEGRDITAQKAQEREIARHREELAREVAQRHRTEAALQSLNATLEQRVHDEVEDRTKAEEQLRQVQKMEAVGRLTGGIAHDFNNMLAVIMGSLNLLQRKLAHGDADVERLANAAIEGTRHAAALTNRLQAFSRQQSLAPERIDPNNLVTGMSDMLARTLGERVRVETVLGAEVGPVMADRAQLENALVNLCINARDAMPDGGTLTLATANAVIDAAEAKNYAIAAGEYVLITTKDAGVGMVPEVMARAFDPFFTTKDVGKGTGLGLSQVYGFVRQSGGHVKVESAPGRGTVVEIYLPRHHGEAIAASAAPAAQRTQVLRGTADEVVMVVEDEPRLRTVSVEALCELGYSVIEAASAHDALRMLGEGRTVSLLFTDVVMPEMSGRELADRARQRVPGLKVLLTTGYTRRAMPRNGALGPDTRLLTKPFSVDQLALRVRQTLDSGTQRTG
ncbi:ATP-binding protein [Variovorax rhizosphaerae]|uniref:histidine kinase n=1 Tax=Variovorax rhizosphaerae TaxID=1836200 RepID=A0ABU8WKF8_9BURK